MDRAIARIRAAGTAEDPGAVAAAEWRRMSSRARAPWEELRRVREIAIDDPPGEVTFTDTATGKAVPAAEVRQRLAQAAAGRAQARSRAGTAMAARGVRAASYAVPGLGEAELAASAIGAVGEILTGDLTVVRWSGKPRIHGEGRRKVTLPGRQYEVHVNPVSIGLGILGLGVAGFVGLMAWNGVTIASGLGNRTQIAPGLKDTGPGKFLAAVPPKSRALYAEAKAAAGVYSSEISGAFQPPPPPPTPQCVQLKAAYDTFIAGGDSTAAFYVRQDAKAKGCPWAQ